MSIETPKKWAQVRKEILIRDQEKCTNCLGSIDSLSDFDVDHNVPVGAGGMSGHRNLGALCRRCHDAKHNGTIAPTIEFESTGQMTDTEFAWFKHFIDEMIPVLMNLVGVYAEPRFNLRGENAWFVPLGDVRRLDKRLADEDVAYRSLRASEYM